MEVTEITSPLRLRPLYMERVWGGRMLESLYCIRPRMSRRGLTGNRRRKCGISRGIQLVNTTEKAAAITERLKDSAFRRA